MIDFTKPFEPRGLAATTAAPMNAQELDVPPGAAPYVTGPLATMPQPSPTPQPQSLSSLAAGGFNHAEAWMAGQAAPPKQIEQKPFDFQPPSSPQTGEPVMNDFTFSATYGKPAY